MVRNSSPGIYPLIVTNTTTDTPSASGWFGGYIQIYDSATIHIELCRIGNEMQKYEIAGRREGSTWGWSSWKQMVTSDDVSLYMHQVVLSGSFNDGDYYIYVTVYNKTPDKLDGKGVSKYVNKDNQYTLSATGNYGENFITGLKKAPKSGEPLYFLYGDDNTSDEITINELWTSDNVIKIL